MRFDILLLLMAIAVLSGCKTPVVAVQQAAPPVEEFIVEEKVETPAPALSPATILPGSWIVKQVVAGFATQSGEAMPVKFTFREDNTMVTTNTQTGEEDVATYKLSGGLLTRYTDGATELYKIIDLQQDMIIMEILQQKVTVVFTLVRQKTE